MDKNILEKAEIYVTQLFQTERSDKLTFHNLVHTLEVLKTARQIGEASTLSEREMQVLLLSSLFHDVGYLYNPKIHEKESKRIARAFLSSYDTNNDLIDQVLKCIQTTTHPQNPTEKIEMVLCDADMSYLSRKDYLEQTLLMRKEWNKIQNKNMKKKKYLKNALSLLKSHHYFTQFGKIELQKGKDENIDLMMTKISKPKKVNSQREAKLHSQGEKLKGKLEKQQIPARGIESMFRLTARHQISLTSLSDNKANIMISVNSIILSIVVTVIIRNISENPNLILPTFAMLLTNLLTIIFAVLATRPHISSGTFTEEDIKAKKVNLLFFGNFYNMEFEDYDWAIKEMMKDSEYLYGNLVQDQYSLGLVLAKKYRLLRTCYNIFMFGIVLSVIAFAVAILYMPRF